MNVLFNRPGIDEDWIFPVLRDRIRPEHIVCVVAFSFYDRDVYDTKTWDSEYDPSIGGYYQAIVNPLFAYGIAKENIVFIDYFRHDADQAKAMIRKADILYFPGGLPDRMMDRIREFDLLGTIRSHRGIVMGFSAGAMIQIDRYHISPDADYPEFAYSEGLGLIRDFDVEVHFQKSPVQLDGIRRSIRETGKPVYAIEETGAVIVEEDRIITCGTVSFYHS